MNKNFKPDQPVVCTLGTNKGKIFIIKSVIKNGYSCTCPDDDKYYFYNDNSLKGDVTHANA